LLFDMSESQLSHLLFDVKAEILSVSNKMHISQEVCRMSYYRKVACVSADFIL